MASQMACNHDLYDRKNMVPRCNAEPNRRALKRCCDMMPCKVYRATPRLTANTLEKAKFIKTPLLLPLMNCMCSGGVNVLSLKGRPFSCIAQRSL